MIYIMPKESFLALLKEKADAQESDKKSFYQEISDIVPIEQDTIETKTAILDKATSKIRREAASRLPEKEAEGASSAFVPMVGPNDILEYRKPGVQPFVIARLRSGEYHEADFIDLHGKTIEKAYQTVMNFISFAKEQEFRCVLIIHGKGERQKEKALIKSYVAHWLRQIPEVLAFHSAPQWKGGSGAVMIILKKGDKASAISREIHARR